MATSWLINGVPGEHLAIDDRGLAYGDGLFETIAVRDGRPRFFERHFARLSTGAERLQLPAPDQAEIEAELRNACAGLSWGTAKIILTRGRGPRGYRPPRDARVTRALGIFTGKKPDPLLYRNGVRLRLCDTSLSENLSLAGLKTLNRLDQVLARAEWDDEQVAEGLMCGLDGRVVCGTMSNLFVVIDECLLTPSLATAGIAGVMRELVLEMAAGLGEPVVVRDLSLEDLGQASECFLTNSQIGLWPVRSIGEQIYTVGPVTRSLMSALVDQGVSECAV
jgi:4-amino-4-deoxychorismate lyase